MSSITIDQNKIFVHVYSAGDEDAMCLRMDSPRDEEETCVITMDPIGQNCEGVCVAFENLPGMSVAEMPCLHRFNCVALIMHFVNTGMHCPICRLGPRTLMQRCSINEPWIASLVADVAAKRRMQLMQQIHEDENIAEEMFRNESGIYPFTTTITFIARSMDGSGVPGVSREEAGQRESESIMNFFFGHGADPGVVGSSSATQTEETHTGNLFFVEGIDQGMIVSDGGDESIDSNQAADAADAGSMVPGIVFGGHTITLQIGSPVVTVEMIACVYLYNSETPGSPDHAIEVRMQRVNVENSSQSIEFNTQLHDLRSLSRLIDEHQAMHIRVVTGYLRLFGGIERVAVSRRIPLFGSEHERALLRMTPTREGRHGRTHSAMGAQIGSGVFLIDTFIQANESQQQWVCVLDRLAFRMPFTNQESQMPS